MSQKTERCMDYSRLSRESLIHELEQLNKALEKVHLERIGEALGVHNLMNELHLPAFWVAPDYSVIWSNYYCVDHQEKNDRNKCYQVFFGLDDVCEQCHLKKVLSNHESAGFQQSGVEVRQLPIVRGGEAVGVLEMHFDMAESIRATEALKDQNAQLRRELKRVRNDYSRDFIGVERFIRSTRFPIETLSHTLNVSGAGAAEELSELASHLLEVFDRGLMYTRYRQGTEPTSKIVFDPIEQLDQVNALLKSPITVETDIDSALSRAVSGNPFDFKLFFAYLLDMHRYVSDDEIIHLNLSQISQTESKVYFNVEIESAIRKDVSWLTSEDHSKYTMDSLEAYIASLGWQFAKQYVTAGKGKMTVSAGVDKLLHTHVTLLLDRVALTENAMPKAVDPLKKRILIADFEKPEISMDIFERFELYFAQDGNSALEMYERLLPDLVIVNVTIENCDGFELYDHLENRFGKRCPVIATSEKLIDNEHAFMKDYGFDDYFPKPVNAQTLDQIFSHYL